MITWVYDMTYAYEYLLSVYANQLDFDCYGHMFLSANEHKGIGVRPAFAKSVSNQHYQMCIKPICRQLKQ